MPSRCCSSAWPRSPAQGAAAVEPDTAVVPAAATARAGRRRRSLHGVPIYIFRVLLGDVTGDFLEVSLVHRDNKRGLFGRHTNIVQ